MNLPFALRQVVGLAGLAGHFTNLPLASRHGAASDGAAPASRLTALNASTIFFMFSSLGTGRLQIRHSSPSCHCQPHYIAAMLARSTYPQDRPEDNHR